jgi:hypothetical protein
MNLFRSKAASCLTMLLAAWAIDAHAGARDGALTLTLENDVLTGSDNNYTNGLGVTWVSPDLGSYGNDQFLGKWGRWWSFLPFVSDEGYSKYAAFTLAQEMHTPDDITNPNPPLDDQPYAGVLYVDSLLYARNERWAHVWELKLGVVGPAAHADDVQRGFHDMIGGDEPMGWDTQLPNEPIVNVGYTVAHLAAAGHAGRSAEWRLVPTASIALGNYFTGVGAGVYGEFGWNLVNAFGGAMLRNGFNAASTVGVGPVDGWSISFFGGVGGYGVAHYLPLDGTAFRDSRSVDSRPFVGSATLGFAVRHAGLTMSVAASTSSEAFEGQQKDAEFGSVNFSWKL